MSVGWFRPTGKKGQRADGERRREGTDGGTEEEVHCSLVPIVSRVSTNRE